MPIEILLPALSSDDDGVTIEAWYKQVGDTVQSGDVLFAIETDKAVVEVEASDSGILGKIIFDAGAENVEVDTLIGYLLEEKESLQDIEKMASEQSVTTESIEKSITSTAVKEAPVVVTPDSSHTNPRVFASPLARRVAVQLSVDLNKLTGSGPNNRILKSDVESAAQIPESQVLESQVPATTELGSYQTIPHSSMRKTIARRLSESKQEVPHFYLSSDFDIDALLILRKQANELSTEGGMSYKLSVNDFIIKACALALRDVPTANASWTKSAIHQYNDVDISVAVATDGGLITPIVRNADKKSLIGISREVTSLAGRAREGKLKPNEFIGGGFSISNLGMYGVKEFSAIINPPQSCILAVGSGEERAVVRNGELQVATVMTCTLSLDHRSVDGAVAAQLMRAIKHYIENPLKLLLESESQS